MEKIEKLVRLVFASHPESKEFNFTSDGQAFKSPSDAANHARSLENKEVALIKRSQLSEGGIILPIKTASVTPVDNGGAKNDFQKKGAKGNAADMGDEAREDLVRKYEMLSGKKAGNMGAEKLTLKVAELEAAAASGTTSKEVVDSAKDVKEPAAETGTGEGDDKTSKSE